MLAVFNFYDIINLSINTNNKLMEKPFLSVIIPAYNEERRLPKTLLAIDKYLSSQDYTYEILVVSDGSKDKTVEIVKKFQKMIKGLRIIDNKENHGKGYVVRQGMLEAKGKYRLFDDADNATSIEQIERFWGWLKPKGSFDIAIGSIGVKGSKIVQDIPGRRIIGKIGNWIIQLLVLWGIRDTQRGFKCFTKEAAEIIFPKQTIMRWAFDVEVLAIARKFGLKIKEVPVVWENDPESKVKLKGMIKFFWSVFEIRINLWRRVYD